MGSVIFIDKISGDRLRYSPGKDPIPRVGETVLLDYAGVEQPKYIVEEVVNAPGEVHVIVTKA